MLIAQTGGINSVVRLITVLLLFLFVLGVTYITSRYVGGFQKKRMSSANIEVIEAARVAPNAVLEIVRAGEKYLLIALAKDQVTMLCELDPATLSLSENPQDAFSAVFEKAKTHLPVLQKKTEENSKEDGPTGEE